jgi:peptidoglycan hydrolase CwlO-like protein
LTVSPAFQSQLDRLTTFINSQDATIVALKTELAAATAAPASTADADDTAALASALDGESVPAAGAPSLPGVSTSLADASTSLTPAPVVNGIVE